MQLVKQAAVGAILACATASAAHAVVVTNPSFESDQPGFAAPGATGWETEGPTGSTGSASVNAGEFTNIPPALDGGDANTLAGLFGFPPIFPPGTIVRRFDNADGASGQEILAFINADPSSRFSQTLAATYQAGQSYTMSVLAGISSVQPPQSATAQAVGQPSGTKLTLQFYWMNGGTRELIGTPSYIVDDFLADGTTRRLQNFHLNEFSVTSPLVAPGAAYEGQPIGIQISAADNPAGSGGQFAFDRVVVTPEPATSMAILAGLAGLVASRPRRY